MQLSASSSYIFFSPNESLSKWLVLHLTHLFPGCRRVLLEPDERTAGAADPVPVPAGHPAAGSGLLRLAGGHHLGDHKQHLQGRLPHPGGPQREGAVLQAHHQPQPFSFLHFFTRHRQNSIINKKKLSRKKDQKKRRDYAAYSLCK